jgi:hypothetical protein
LQTVIELAVTPRSEAKLPLPAPPEPVEWVEPFEPFEPVEPLVPVLPVDPPEPVLPVDPVDPVEPVEPVEPVLPVDPGPPAGRAPGLPRLELPPVVPGWLPVAPPGPAVVAVVGLTMNGANAESDSRVPHPVITRTAATATRGRRCRFRPLMRHRRQ